MKILGLMISNGLVSLSGAMIAQSQNFADVQMGTGSIVIGPASLIIGEVLFGRRNFFSRLFPSSWGRHLPVIIAMVLKLACPPTILKLFTAITVALALSLPMFQDYLNTIRRSMRGRQNC